jgi:hypothetical protein
MHNSVDEYTAPSEPSGVDVETQLINRATDGNGDPVSIQVDLLSAVPRTP